MDGGWEFDQLLGPLQGIFLLELEKSDVATNLIKPWWVKDWIEVTDTLNNRMLARLSYELEHGDEPGADILRHVLPPSIKRLVLTGAPCSGKTTILEILKARYGDRIHCVPEAATIVMGQLGVRPPPGADKLQMRRFQLQLGRAQLSFEALSLMQAANDGKKLVVFDRGVADNAAYMSRGNIAPLAKLLMMSPKQIYRRYDGVIQLGIPSEKVYERNRVNNPHRKETYEQAAELDRYITDAWEDHSHYRPIGDREWDAKVKDVLQQVDKLLAA